MEKFYIAMIIFWAVVTIGLLSFIAMVIPHEEETGDYCKTFLPKLMTMTGNQFVIENDVYKSKCL
jgi:ABC-type enterochelin transport system permease subunit